MEVKTLDWRLVWIVFVSDYRNSAISISDSLSKQAEPSSSTANLSVGVTDPSNNYLTINWTDAGEGTLSVKSRQTLSNESFPAFEIAFGAGRAEIDPTFVVHTSGTTPTEYSFQRKVFWYGGYYWAFYDRGDKICYNRSADGSVWSYGNELPGALPVLAGTGFDVAHRNDIVAICWKSYDAGDARLFFIKGQLVGSSIIWSSRSMIPDLINVQSPPSVAIATDGVFWVASAKTVGSLEFEVYYSYDGTNFWATLYHARTFADGTQNCYVLMPLPNGDIALLEASNGGFAGGKVRVRYYNTSVGWGSPIDCSVGMCSGNPKGKFSAIASSDGSIHLAFIGTALNLRYALIMQAPFTTYCFDLTTTSITGQPSICLDASGDLHIFYWTNEAWYTVMRHTQRHTTWLHANPTESLVWTDPDAFYYFDTQVQLNGLTIWDTPVGTLALLWTESGTQVRFGTIPLPYGTPGAQAQPWSREGFSPYGTYFSANGDYVSPGSGLLTLMASDISVPSRAGLILGASRIYMQPKYFRVPGGAPYMPAGYPYCNLGPGWSLDLPWMDKDFVGIIGGQRFIIAWGNTGVEDVFENHDGAHFTLRHVSQPGPHGANEFYELVMASGERYVFDLNYRLFEISDLQGYDPDAQSYSDSTNILWVDYDEYGRIRAIREDDFGRRIDFVYNSSCNLWKITGPDSATMTFGYTSYNDINYLTSAKDSANRTTRYDWTGLGSPPYYDYTIKSVTVPTGGVTEYDYSADPPPSPSPATEVRSWFVTSVKVKNSAAGPLIRQTDFDYRVVNGRVRFCKQVDKNESQAIQGYTEYIFQSTLMYTSLTKKTAPGVQMGRTDTWYDSAGQPMRVDTYKATSQIINYTEYTRSDDWGNVIYTRDALGHETYQSYANTRTQNSFQGGSILSRTGSGRIFYDSFDDWNMSDWKTSLGGGNSATLDGNEDPANAPALNITRINRNENAHVNHSIGAQTGPFIIQTRFMVSNSHRAFLLGMASGGTVFRIYFWTENQRYYWYTGSGNPHEVLNAPACLPRVWHDIGFRVDTNNSYQVYVDGVSYGWAVMCGASGFIDTVRFQANYNTGDAITMLVDEVRVYSGLSVSIDTDGFGYIAELYDATGRLLDRSRSSYQGSISLNLTDSSPPSLPLTFPPGFVKIAKQGYSAFESPMMDIWGGDNYALSARFEISSPSKSRTGYAEYDSPKISDDSFPGTTVDNYDLDWVPDSDNATSGSKYHTSGLSYGSHWHGFVDAAYTAFPSHVLTQYVWLTEGMVPVEIAIQFKLGGVWWRAYWGTSSSCIDIGAYNAHLDHTVRIGDMPRTTGEWLQLTVLTDALGVVAPVVLSGVIYALSGGTAKWDLTSQYDPGIEIAGVAEGQTAELRLDNGAWVSGTAGPTGLLVLDLYSSGVRVFPVSGHLDILQGTQLLMEGPICGIWNGDEFQVSSTAAPFYANSVKRLIHDRPVGSLEYMDYARLYAEKTFLKCDSEGYAIESKSKLGSGWIHTQAGYDAYGNLLWSTDASGRATYTDFGPEDRYTYPKSTTTGWRTDTFDTDDSWTVSPGAPSWMSCTYSTDKAWSAEQSVKASFSGAPSGFGTAALTKEYAWAQNPILELSVNIYLEAAHHDNNTYDLMDTGIRMWLYDSNDWNYATLTYWLACWSGSTDNRSSPNQSTRVVYGVDNLSRETWKRVVLYPSADWPGIDWWSCLKVKFELYETASYAYGDYLTVYYDDLSYNDFAVNPVTTFTYSRTGDLLSVTDPLGHTTSQQLDAIGRVIKENNSDGSFREMSYNDSANKMTVWDELRHKTVSYFDSIGRITMVERWGGGTAAYSWVTCTYNWMDQVASYTDERGHVTRHTYDYFGRQTSVRNPDMSSVVAAFWDYHNLVDTCSYDTGGQLTHKSVKVFDYLGRLNSTREYTTGSAYNATWMTYDGVGNLLTVEDAKGQTTRMLYDRLNRIIMTTYPDSREEFVFEYDGAGRPLWKWDRERNDTYLSYDSAGNLIKLGSADETIFRTYDAIGNLIVASNNLGGIQYSYDDRGRMRSMQEWVYGEGTLASLFTYDTDGKLINLTYPYGPRIQYHYDPYDRVDSVTRVGGETLLTVAYNKDDTISTETTGDGTKVTVYGYDSRDRVSSMVTRLSGEVKLALFYTYDDVGNVKQLVVNTTGNSNNAKTETYTYDWLDRIKGASGGNLPSGLTYRYDAVGNPTTFAGKTCTFGNINNITYDGTWSYSYDKNGNRAWKTKSNEKWNYQFNSLDQLTKVVKWAKSGSSWTPTIQGEYWYDANGMMAKSLQSGTTSIYFYMGHEPLVEKVGSTNTYYVYANGRAFAKITGSTTYYYIRDALGSTRQVWQSGQTSPTFSVATYKPYGTPVTPSGTEKFEYAGEMIMSAAGTSPGLYYIGARWMDPELGRWLSLDPELGKLSAPQTMNRYVYCGNNPLRFTDPTGMDSWSGVSKWWDKHWREVVVVAAVLTITVLTCGVGAVGLVALTEMTAVDLATSMTVGAAVGAGVNMGLTGMTTGDWSLENMASAGISGAIMGATSVLGSSLMLEGAIGLGLAVGGLGGMSSYVFGQATKSIIPGGAYGHLSIGGLAWSGAMGMISVGATYGLSKLFTPAGSSESYYRGVGGFIKDLGKNIGPGELGPRLVASTVGGAVGGTLKFLSAWGQKEVGLWGPISNCMVLPMFDAL